MFKMSISALAIVLNESSICTKSMFFNINVHFLIIIPLHSKKSFNIAFVLFVRQIIQIVKSNNMKIEINQTTLIDQVEDSLLTYFKKNDLRCGDSIPNENNLAAELGVARSVVREALSRLKMMGLIHARPRKGMVLTEPSILGGMKRVIDPRVLSEETILDLLDFRIALEIGISSDIFRKITPKDIEELSEIVKMGIVFENNEYALISESAFHTKLYKITGNKIISEFQEIIHPILVYVKEKFKDYLKPINIEMSKSGRIATHADLLDFIRKGDEKGYRDAIERHFEVYKIFKVNRSLELMAEKNEEERIDSI